MKLVSKTKRGKATAYTVQMSGKEFNIPRMCFNAVINSAGTEGIADATPYSESTINAIDIQLRKIADAAPSEPQA